MSQRPIIRVAGLGKEYQIHKIHRSYRTLRDSLSALVHAPWRALRGKVESEFESLWALKDANFEIEPGEVVGIIGRNGAGKSTLLKILSRITPPTTGEAELFGRVGSLLEVGTGFHPELTGKENVYLNGAILGMTRREIARKYDAIVAFAGIEAFMESPVKHYSSGMYMRLAFAVAAHLDPEILIVDEVLTVGDAAFQKACLGKVRDIAGSGRTVILVSHYMPAVKALCSRVMQLDGGAVVQDGDPEHVIANYLRDGNRDVSPERTWEKVEDAPGNADFRLRGLRVRNAQGEVSRICSSRQPITIEIEFDLQTLHSSLVVGFELIHRDGVVIFKTSHNDRAEQEWPTMHLGRNRLRCRIPEGLLNAGIYYVAPKAHLHGFAWLLKGDAEVSFEVLLDHSASPFWNLGGGEVNTGVIAPCLPWDAA